MTDERHVPDLGGSADSDTIVVTSPDAATAVTPIADAGFSAPDPGTRVDGPPAPALEMPQFSAPEVVAHDTAVYAAPGYPSAPPSGPVDRDVPVAYEPPLLGFTDVSTGPQPPVADPWAAPVQPTSPLEYGAPVVPEPRRGTGKVVAIAVASGLLAGVVGGAGAYAVAERMDSGSLTSSGAVIPQTDADLSARPSGSVARVAAAVLPTVVQITERSGTGNGGGTGSGFVIREDGYILTNNHVVEGAADGGSLSVTFQDGSTKPAKIVGRDTSYDLAVIKVDADGARHRRRSATPTAWSSATPRSRSARRSGSTAP